MAPLPCFQGHSYGLMGLKVCQKFPPRLAMVHGWPFELWKTGPKNQHLSRPSESCFWGGKLREILGICQGLPKRHRPLFFVPPLWHSVEIPSGLLIRMKLMEDLGLPMGIAKATLRFPQECVGIWVSRLDGQDLLNECSGGGSNCQNIFPQLLSTSRYHSRSLMIVCNSCCQDTRLETSNPALHKFQFRGWTLQ